MVYSNGNNVFGSLFGSPFGGGGSQSFGGFSQGYPGYSQYGGGSSGLGQNINSLIHSLFNPKPKPTYVRPRQQVVKKIIKEPMIRDHINAKGGLTFNGSHADINAKDNGGRDVYNLGGFDNVLRVHGDKGPNKFKLGGEENTLDVKNIGKDDHVYLYGHRSEWDLVDEFHRNGGAAVVFFNTVTGNEAILSTDDGRGQGFLLDRIHFD